MRKTTRAMATMVLTCGLLGIAACDSASVARPKDSRRAGQPSDRDQVLVKAARWLWSQQAEDGGWHSSTYRLLESGQALTPFVLHALLQVDPSICERPLGGIARARQFIRRQVGADGCVGLTDPEVPEYPNYATAYALMCLLEGADAKDQPLIERMKRYLMAQQYCEQTGFGPETVVYGGWGFGGPLPIGGSPGHMDIHHARCVLQALQRAGVDDPVLFERGEQFLRLMQRHPDLLLSRPAQRDVADFAVWNGPYDGGFYFSPVVLAANKAGPAGETGSEYYRSYASPTCDGILALLACGVDLDDERIKAAINWLADHPAFDWPGGVPKDSVENWGASIRFTHYACRAQVMAAVGASARESDPLNRLLASQQDPDGRFKNEVGFLMKEDDPLVCTTLAVLALANLPRQTP